MAGYALPAQNVRINGDKGDGVQSDVWVSSHNLKIEIAGITTGDDGKPGTSGYVPIEIYDMQSGNEAAITPLGELYSVQRVRAVGAPFSNGYWDDNFWSSGTLTTNGDVRVSSAVVALYASTSTSVNGAVVMQSNKVARFIDASVNEYRAVIRISTAIPATGTNDMRWGLSDSVDLSTTNLRNGYYFRFSNGAAYVGYRLAGTEMSVATTSWTGTVPNFSNNFMRYTIVYGSLGAAFYINNKFVHSFSGTTEPLTETSNFKARAQNINSGGSASNNVLQVKAMAIINVGRESSVPGYIHNNTAFSKLLKYGPGFLHHIAINDSGSPVSSYTIYDSTFAAAGKQIAIINTNGSSLGNINYGLPFSALYVVGTGTFGDITLVYE